MMKALFKEEGASLRVEILEDPSVQSFIDTHAGILDSAFKETQMSDVMRRHLQASDRVFSGFKTFHELNESFPQLLDENGKRKPFEQFLNDVRKVDDTYNRRYLNAEYNFAQTSAEMAGRWEKFDDDDRYYLQYRTQHDDKVRPEHAELEGITLPKSDSFWDEYYPPNGWNCRCTVVEVRRDKYRKSNHEDAMARGARTLRNDKKGMFKFNPGKEQKTFPDYNPYTISKCKGCDKAQLKLAIKIPATDICAGCTLLHGSNSDQKELQKEYYDFDSNQWIHHRLTDSGYVVVDNDRPPKQEAHINEHSKYKKELSMCEELAEMGHRIKFLSEHNRNNGTFDIFFDDISADLKKIESNGSSIPKYTKHAFRQQGADIVIFCIPSHSATIYEKLTEASRKYGNEGRIFFYFTDDMRLREIKKRS